MPGRRNRKQFTPGEIAVMFDVAAATVVTWCKNGALACHQLPGRGDRRIMPEALLQFCRLQNIPVPEELKPYISEFKSDPPWLKKLAMAPKRKGFHCSAAEAGAIAAAYRMKDVQCSQLATVFREYLEGYDVRDVAEELIAKILPNKTV
jgi:hypothetical protein